MMEHYTKVAAIDNEIESQLLEEILSDLKIPHVTRSYHDTAYDGIYQLQKGWGAIYAPEPYRKEINKILLELRKAEPLDLLEE